MSRTHGAVAYAVYRERTSGKTWDGREMPEWSDLTDLIQAAWEAAAQAVLRRNEGES